VNIATWLQNIDYAASAALATELVATMFTGPVLSTGESGGYAQPVLVGEGVVKPVLKES
jgi:hypothetical protein